MSGTRYGQSHSFINDFGLQILTPAELTKLVQTVQACHLTLATRQITNFAAELFGSGAFRQRLGRRGGLEWIDNVSILEQTVLISVVEALHELFLVPSEMVQENSGRGWR